MPNDTSGAPKQINVNGLIGLYLEIREAKEAAAQQHKDEIALFDQRLDKIANVLHGHMRDYNLKSLPTEAGTAYINTLNSASTTDGAAFRGFIIENRAWDMVDWRPNKIAVAGFIEEHQTLPPGINWSSMDRVLCRKGRV